MISTMNFIAVLFSTVLMMNPSSPYAPPSKTPFIDPTGYVVAEKPDEIPEEETCIEVDLSEQKLFLNSKNKVLRVYEISSGGAGRETKTGLFRIYAKYTSYPSWGIDWHYDLPFAMFFHHDLAIHGAYWHNDFGTPVSHGCINMRVQDAEALYSKVPKWTYVYVHE